MELSLLDRALWAASFLGNAALVTILFERRRVRIFPLFTLYIAYEIVVALGLFAAYRLATVRAYAVTYWCSTALDFLLMLGVLAEIAYIVFRPAPQWMQRSYPRFLWFGLPAVVLAAVLSLSVHPAGFSSLSLWGMRENLFISIVTCELFTVILFTSQQRGLHWRSHVMHLGYGLTLWALLSFLIDGLHAYWGAAHHLVTLEHLRIFGYLAALGLWIVSFWRDEPKRALATPEMQNTALHLSSRLSYDLEQALRKERR